MSFLINDKNQQQDTQKEPNYYATKPFAAGEIYVGSLLNSLMCQSYYSEKMLDILEQMILGNSFVPQEITNVYEQLNLNMCSLNLVEIPHGCTSMTFKAIFEFCVRNCKMVPIGVYKQIDQEQEEARIDTKQEQNKIPEHKREVNPGQKYKEQPDEEQKKTDSDQKNNLADEDESHFNKQYVWLHPPKNIELGKNDNLFVLSNAKRQEDMGGVLPTVLDPNMKNMKNEEKKNQEQDIDRFKKLNGSLQELLSTTRELQSDVHDAKQFVSENLLSKLRSSLAAPIGEVTRKGGQK